MSLAGYRANTHLFTVALQVGVEGDVTLRVVTHGPQPIVTATATTVAFLPRHVVRHHRPDPRFARPAGDGVVVRCLSFFFFFFPCVVQVQQTWVTVTFQLSGQHSGQVEHAAGAGQGQMRQGQGVMRQGQAQKKNLQTLPRSRYSSHWFFFLSRSSTQPRKRGFRIRLRDN